MAKGHQEHASARSGNGADASLADHYASLAPAAAELKRVTNPRSKGTAAEIRAAQAEVDRLGAPIVAHWQARLAPLAARFATEDFNAATIRDAYVYADNSVSFGNGQFPHVPAHFDPGALDVQLARRALALSTARSAATPVLDDDMGTIVAKAEAAGSAEYSLLEESLDWWFQAYIGMSAEEKTAMGYDMKIGEDTADGKFRPYSSITDRAPLVSRILGLGVDAVVPDGLPNAGETWFSVVGQAIVDYILVIRPYNKKSAQTKATRTFASAPGGERKSLGNMI